MKLKIQIFALLVMLSLSSCMTTRVVAEYDSNRPTPQTITKWPLLWGVLQPKDHKVDDKCSCICQVESKTNIGFILLSAVTLGIVTPMRMEYQCCAYDPGNSKI